MSSFAVSQHKPASVESSAQAEDDAIAQGVNVGRGEHSDIPMCQGTLVPVTHTTDQVVGHQNLSENFMNFSVYLGELQVTW